MTHATPERLNEYLDGWLEAEGRAELEAHLGSCRRCRDELEELRRLVAQLGKLPRAGRPRHDLWPEVATRTLRRRPRTEAEIAVRFRDWRRLRLSLPQAAAAAVLVGLLAGGTVWLALGGSDGEPVGSGGVSGDATPHLVTTPVGLEAYDRIVSDLTRQLNRRVGELDPRTVAAIQANLEIIDAAILEIDAALARDPGNPYLNAYLARAMRKKVDVLRRASPAHTIERQRS